MSRLDGNRQTSGYIGVESWTPFDGKVEKRAPTPDDWKGYHLGCFWFNKITKNLWYLAGLAGNQADWKLLSVGLTSGILTLTGNIGGPVGSDGVGNVDFMGVGSLEIVGNPGANTLLIEGLGGTNPAILFTEDVGSATPDGVGNINVLGGTGITTDGTGSTITISTDGTFASQYDCDAGTAVPIANILDIIGDGSYITTLGGSNIVEISLTDLVAKRYVTDVGTAIAAGGILNVLGDSVNTVTLGGGNTVTVELASFGDGVLFSNADVIAGSSGTDGQVIIGATGAMPAWGSITSSDSTITIISGPNTIDLKALGGPGFVSPGDNINIAPANTVNLNETIHWPHTNSAGTSGMIYLGGASGTGGSRFMHNYGPHNLYYENTFLGINAGNLTLNTTLAYQNTGIGNHSLTSVTTGKTNVALGTQTLGKLTTGLENTALGEQAGRELISGRDNVFVGQNSGLTMTTGNYNVGVGNGTLKYQTSSNYNTAVGFDAISVNGSGDYNTALGREALRDLSTGANNIGVGNTAGSRITTGNHNVVIGYRTTQSLTTGSYNIVLGSSSGINITGSTSSSIAIGHYASTNGHRIYIGTHGSGDGQQNQCYIAGIYGISASGGTAVYINSSNQLGTSTSSIRYKTEVEDLGETSVLSLRPITFEYKNDLGTKNYGLIAEEVVKIMPQLVIRNKEGLPDQVKYHDLPILLLNEVKKLDKRVKELEKSNKRIEDLENRLKSLELKVL